jgi:hypothetical protein
VATSANALLIDIRLPRHRLAIEPRLASSDFLAGCSAAPAAESSQQAEPRALAPQQCSLCMDDLRLRKTASPPQQSKLEVNRPLLASAMLSPDPPSDKEGQLPSTVPAPHGAGDAAVAVSTENPVQQPAAAAGEDSEPTYDDDYREPKNSSSSITASFCKNVCGAKLHGNVSTLYHCSANAGREVTGPGGTRHRFTMWPFILQVRRIKNPYWSVTSSASAAFMFFSLTNSSAGGPGLPMHIGHLLSDRRRFYTFLGFSRS